MLPLSNQLLNDIRQALLDMAEIRKIELELYKYDRQKISSLICNGLDRGILYFDEDMKLTFSDSYADQAISAETIRPTSPA